MIVVVVVVVVVAVEVVVVVVAVVVVVVLTSRGGYDDGWSTALCLVSVLPKALLANGVRAEMGCW